MKKIKDAAAVSLGKKRWQGKTAEEKKAFSEKGIATRKAKREKTNENNQ